MATVARHAAMARDKETTTEATEVTNSTDREDIRDTAVTETTVKTTEAGALPTLAGC